MLKALPAPASEPQHGFAIVGVGASAGGLEAFIDLLHSLPDEPGMAFVLIQHQDREHASALSQILSRATRMPVEEVHRQTVIEPNHVYVAPPDGQLSIEEGTLQVLARPAGRSMPIDVFFKALAADQGRRAVGVVLSGTQDDGTLGTEAVKAAGGITFAQDESAKFPGMPHNAADAGSVDYVMSPSGIAGALLRINLKEDPEAALPNPQLAHVFELLARAYNVNFAQYKGTTVRRRIRRRMRARRTDSLDEYMRTLRDDPTELATLYSELLIHVTGFFRDPQVFAAVEQIVAPELMKLGRESDDRIRIWVPGCATGEEAYSLAIVMLDVAEKSGFSCPIQIFGTDISEEAIENARTGIYPASAMENVSRERLHRYFTETGDSYRVKKSLRDCCVFARQNVTRDPPFARLDLISCRNVMIYLGPILQQRAMEIFHFALRPGGFLLLGSAETIGRSADLFTIADRRSKIYRKHPARGPLLHFATPARAQHKPREEPVNPTDRNVLQSGASVLHEADRVVMARYAPAGVVIDDNMDILQFRGRTGPFLEPAAGSATLNLLKMLREGLLTEVRAAVHAARKSGSIVRRDGIECRRDDGSASVNVEVIPFLSSSNERHFVVLFEDARPRVEEKKKRGKRAEPEEDTRQLTRLKRELDATREYLQAIIQEQEAMNEELRSANEEIQSSNEELQSTNEELETAKEELQSTNEELMTLNEELETRNDELTTVNNDLMNVLYSVEIPIVMVDSAQKIRRFNPSAQRAFNLVSADIGHSINDLKTTLLLDDLESVIGEVVDTLKVRDVDVEDRKGRKLTLRVRPYKTLDNRIEGAVLALLDRSTPVAISAGG